MSVSFFGADICFFITLPQPVLHRAWHVVSPRANKKLFFETKNRLKKRFFVVEFKLFIYLNTFYVLNTIHKIDHLLNLQ